MHRILIKIMSSKDLLLRQGRSRGASGVYTIEMAIIIPLLLVLIFAVIDLCQVTAQRTLLLSAMHSAGRAAALENDPLSAYDAAVDNFENHQQENLVPGRLVGEDLSDPVMKPILSPDFRSIAIGNSCMCGIFLTLNASVSCEFFCRPIAGIGQMMGNSGRQPLIMQGFYPFEDQTLCPSIC